jgi:hypothetical protein
LLSLLRRIETDGPLQAREAVRLGARLARTIEALREEGRGHGALDAEQVLLPTRLLHDAIVRRPPVDRPADEVDDARAIARLLHFVLTGHAAGPTEKLPPLAVFDCGDDELETLVDDLVRLEDATTSVVTLRMRLDEWLAREGAPTDERLAWEGEARRSNLDLSSLPPPPAASQDDVPDVGVQEPEDEDADRPTVPGEALAPVSPRRPRIVPPKLKGKLKSDAEPTPLPAPIASAPEAPRSGEPRDRGSRGPLVVGAVAALTVGGFFLLRGDEGPSPLPSEASGAPVVHSVPASSSSRTSASSSAPASTSAQVTTAAPSAASPPSTDERRDRCVTSALPPDTFEGTFVDFAPVCSASDVLDGASRFRETIVRGGHGRPVTSGMREWSQLGFFELAAFAAIHGRCCEGAALAVPASPAACPTSVEAAIEGVVKADSSSKKALKRPLTDLEKAFRCVSRSGAEKRFGGHPPLSGGEGTPLTRILTRLSKVTP